MANEKVFVIDDEHENRAYLTAIITGAGFDVEAFEDGAEAIEKMKAEPPAMVFLDVQMPRINGFQVLKEIRQSEGLADIPVVLLSAISAVTGEDYNPDVIETRYGVRPDAFVAKPIDPDGVQEQLAKFLHPEPA